MKKVLTFSICFLVFALSAHASDLADDYVDIAADYCAKGNYREAMTYLNKILTVEPGNQEVKILKLNLEQIMNPTIRTTNPVKPDMLSNALTQFDQKKYNDALITVNSYLKSNPNSDMAYALRAKINISQGQYSLAESDISRAIFIKNDITYRLIEGEVLYYQGNYSLAKQKLTPLAKELQISDTYKYIGLCDYAIRNYTDALLNLDRAIILSDDDSELNAKYNEVRAYIKQ